MDTSAIVKQLRDEANHLTQAANILENKQTITSEIRPMSAAANHTPIGKKRTGRRHLSKEARKRISEAQKARWAERKQGRMAA